eukprot:gene3935-8407_t
MDFNTIVCQSRSMRIHANTHTHTHTRNHAHKQTHPQTSGLCRPLLTRRQQLLTPHPAATPHPPQQHSTAQHKECSCCCACEHFSPTPGGPDDGVIMASHLSQLQAMD